jgi:hypothetical protein
LGRSGDGVVRQARQGRIADTRVGKIAFQAIHTRGPKSEEQQAALAAVGYPGY